MKKLLFLTAIMLIAFPSLLLADLYLKSVTHTGAFEMMGQKQEASETAQEVWIGDNKMRVDTEGNTILFDIENKHFYILYHGKKQYFQTNLPIDLKSIVPEEQAGFMDMMKFEVSINPLEEKKLIKDWNCTSYQMEMKSAMVNMSGTVWATEDIKVDQAKMNDFYVNTSALQNVSGDSIKELTKIKGVQVMSETITEIMGSKIDQKQELQMAEEREVSDDHYSIPEDYVKVEQFMPIE